MSSPSEEKLRIHVNVEISTQALQAIVSNAKKLAAKSENGAYRIDTADQVSQMITRFLQEKSFDEFVNDIDNYTT